MLVRRANYVRQHIKKLTGGAPQRRFLSKDWMLSLEHSEIELLITVEKIRELQEDVAVLVERNAEVESQFQKVKSDNTELTIQTESLQNKVQGLTDEVTALSKETQRVMREKDEAEKSM